MDTNIALSKNLKLTCIQENNWENGNLIAVICYFDFFGEEGVAYVVVDKIDSEYASYTMTEMTAELSESFNELLDDENNWKKIGIEVKKYIDHWNLENAQDDIEQ